MKPGSTELDREVAAKVYKDSIPHEWRRIGDIGAYDECMVCGETAGEGKGEELGCIPPFSGCIEAAWKLVEKLSEDLCDFSLEKSGFNWTASWPGFHATSNSPCRAICLAAMEFYNAKDAS